MTNFALLITTLNLIYFHNFNSIIGCFEVIIGYLEAIIDCFEAYLPNPNNVFKINFYHFK